MRARARGTFERLALRQVEVVGIAQDGRPIAANCCFGRIFEQKRKSSLHSERRTNALEVAVVHVKVRHPSPWREILGQMLGPRTLASDSPHKVPIKPYLIQNPFSSRSHDRHDHMISASEKGRFRRDGGLHSSEAERLGSPRAFSRPGAHFGAHFGSCWWCVVHSGSSIMNGEATRLTEAGGGYQSSMYAGYHSLPVSQPSGYEDLILEPSMRYEASNDKRSQAHPCSCYFSPLQRAVSSAQGDPSLPVP